MPRLIHAQTNQVLAEDVIFSHSFWSRIKGLLGYTTLHQNQVMWIRPCSSIHTFFMKFPIDIVFVDRNLRIQSFYENVKPWKFVSAWNLSSLKWLLKPSSYKNFFNISVFEFNAGHLPQFSLKKGDSVYVDA